MTKKIKIQNFKSKMRCKVDKKRWAYAQSYEKKYWTQLSQQNIKGQKKIEEDYWKFHLTIFNRYFRTASEKRILEIGTGICPSLKYINVGKKYALDPLMDYYKSNFEMPEEIANVKGIGEEMPFPNNYFDAVITTNSIDHVKNPIQVISEIKRVLKQNGILYITVNCWIPLLRYYRQLKEYFDLGDQGHPHSFSVNSFKILMESTGLKVLSSENGIKEIGGYVANSQLSKSRSKESIFRKIFSLYRNHGIFTIFDRIIIKILSYTGSIFSIEKREITDFIFVAKK